MCVFVCLCISLSVCLSIERSLEDHENVVEALAHWPKGNTSNQILFRNNPDKFLLLQRPQLFVPTTHIYATGAGTGSRSSEIFSEEKKKQMLLKVCTCDIQMHMQKHTCTHTCTTHTNTLRACTRVCVHTHTHTIYPLIFHTHHIHTAHAYTTHTHTHTHTYTYTHTIDPFPHTYIGAV